jgi:hypothetical protein
MFTSDSKKIIMKKIILNTIKMKRVFALTLATILSAAMVSCVHDDDFTIPETLGTEENQRLNDLLNSNATTISIADLKNQFTFGQATKIQSDIYVKGYVTSSDATGNFYKEFFIQDNPSNPTAGMKVVLNQVDSYNQFNVGREVYIKLQGLYIGETRSGDDVITIGGQINEDGDEVDELTANQIPNHIFRSEVTETLVPMTLKLSDVNDAHIGMYIMFENAQFSNSLAGESFVDPNDDFDTSRLIESCDGFDYTYFPMETSAFANFKNVILDTNAGGTIAGVINKTFNGSNTVLVLNSIEDVNLTNSKCEPLDINDFTTIFEEDFQEAIDDTNLDIADWTNFAEEGGELWTEQVFGGNGYTEFSGFRTFDAVNIGWLVSPGIDMDAQDNELLNFKTAQHHLDSVDNTLEVFVSTDYDGTNVLAATWMPIEANLANINDSWYSFKDSGLIDISGYSGTLHVAFKFVGSGTDTTLDGTYFVDDFRVLRN